MASDVVVRQYRMEDADMMQRGLLCCTVILSIGMRLHVVGHLAPHTIA